MVSSTLSRQPATVEEATQDTRIQQWLQEKGWQLVSPCNDWNYWHLELGNGSILPVTQSFLIQLYHKDHPLGGF